MEKETFTKEKWLKSTIPLLIAAMAIALFKYGYGFGQWLKTVWP